VPEGESAGDPVVCDLMQIAAALGARPMLALVAAVDVPAATAAAVEGAIDGVVICAAAGGATASPATSLA